MEMALDLSVKHLQFFIPNPLTLQNLKNNNNTNIIGIIQSNE